jgi:hypothetical protein
MKVQLLVCFVVLVISTNLFGQSANKSCNTVAYFGKHSGSFSISKIDLEKVFCLTAINDCKSSDTLNIVSFQVTSSVNGKTVFSNNGQECFSSLTKEILKSVAPNTKIFLDNIKVKNPKTGTISTGQGITLIVK